ncbi:MAG: hypothetical protein OSB05_12275 [Akkermansiaceae bacterium]|nr:hypothetical protein [Akkermansiaceae bacterium]
MPGRWNMFCMLSATKVEDGELKLTVENRGMAPFHHDRLVELWAGTTTKIDWKLSEALRRAETVWTAKLPKKGEVSINDRREDAHSRGVKMAVERPLALIQTFARGGRG